MPRTSVEYEQAQRERIIQGAARVFATYGYRQTTMDQIAQALALSKGALYIYFKTKEELFTAAIKGFNQQRMQRLESSLQAGKTVRERLEHLLTGFSELLAADDQVYVRLWLEGFLQSAYIPQVQHIKNEVYRSFGEALTQLLLEGQREGVVNPTVEVDHLVTILQATFDGLLLHTLIENRKITAERVQLLVEGTFYRWLVLEQKKP